MQHALPVTELPISSSREGVLRVTNFGSRKYSSPDDDGYGPGKDEEYNDNDSELEGSDVDEADNVTSAPAEEEGSEEDEENERDEEKADDDASDDDGGVDGMVLKDTGYGEY